MVFVVFWQTKEKSFLCVIVTVTTFSVGDGVINFEDVLTSVAVTVCVEVSMMVVTTFKEVRERHNFFTALPN